MAVALETNCRRIVARSPWVRRPRTEPEAVVAALMLGVLLAAFTVAVLLSQALDAAPFHLPRPRRDQAVPARSSATVVPAPAAPQAEVETAPEATPAAPDEAASTRAAALTVGGRARVANTDGLGVVLHSAPSTSARQPAGLLEGMRVTVVEVAGSEWVRVHAASGQAGWIPTAFLAADE